MPRKPTGQAGGMAAGRRGTRNEPWENTLGVRPEFHACADGVHYACGGYPLQDEGGDHECVRHNHGCVPPPEGWQAWIAARDKEVA